MLGEDVRWVVDCLGRRHLDGFMCGWMMIVVWSLIQIKFVKQGSQEKYVSDYAQVFKEEEMRIICSSWHIALRSNFY